MTGSSPPSSSILAIELLPEFGWSVQGQPAFGPGSVFQGTSTAYMKIKENFP